MKAGPADGARGDPNDRIQGMLDIWFGHVLQADVSHVVEYDRFHSCLLETISQGRNPGPRGPHYVPTTQP